MFIFEIVIALLMCGAILAAVARRLSTPYPALVAVGGAALAFLPGVPALALDPELALALFVAPVLLDAAFDSSPRDMRANWRLIASLVLGAVFLTVFAVAIVTRWVVPAIPWAVAIALGAIVAPPDAAAASAVLRQLRPPYRLLVILEGESLFNDASALLTYRVAVGAAIGTLVVGWNVVPMIVVVTIGSVILGLVLSRAITWLNAQIENVSTAVVMQFCGTFAVWLLAERLHLSGILTMVVFAIATARRAAQMIPARIRVPSYAVWEVAVFVLNVLAFILAGFQLKSIMARVDRATLVDYAYLAAIVCLATIVARIVWVIIASAVGRWWCSGRRTDQVSLSRGESAVVGWCGMRGTVTLAAALALPPNFPYRDLILFTSFAVVLGTLVVQGMTLRPLMQWLQLRDDGSVEREVQLARAQTLRAGLAAVGSSDADEAKFLRSRYELLLRRSGSDPIGKEEDAGAAVRAATVAARQRLVALREEGVIGDAAFQLVEQDLDLEELDLQQLLPPK